jgi:hypothetical protein
VIAEVERESQLATYVTLRLVSISTTMDVPPARGAICRIGTRAPSTSN